MILNSLRTKPTCVNYSTVREALVFGRTALSCLASLKSPNAVNRGYHNFDFSNYLDGDGLLPISTLVTAADELGFRAQYIICDWQSLKLVIVPSPVLLLLKNKNAVLAMGIESDNAEEVLISDPLYRNGKVFVLPRENLERAWDGDVVTLLPRADEGGGLSTVLQARAAGPLKSCEESPDVIVERHSSAKFRPLGTEGDGRQHKISALAIPLVAALSVTVLVSKGNLEGDRNQTPAALKPIVERTSEIGKATTQIDNANTMVVISLHTAPIPEAVEPYLKSVKALQESAAAPVEGEPPDALPDFMQLPAALPASRLVPVPSITAKSVIVPTPPLMQSANVAEGTKGLLDLSVEDISVLVTRGDDYFAAFDVVSGRLFYERAADAGSAEAALRLGETFDPAFLKLLHLTGNVGDMAKAFYWYRRASDLGSVKAQVLLADEKGP